MEWGICEDCIAGRKLSLYRAWCVAAGAAAVAAAWQETDTGAEQRLAGPGAEEPCASSVSVMCESCILGSRTSRLPATGPGLRRHILPHRPAFQSAFAYGCQVR